MSSELVFTPETTPSAPSGSTVALFADTNDNSRLKLQHPNGAIDIISETNRYNYLVNGGFDFIQRWPTALTTNTQTTPGNRYINHDNWSGVFQTASCQAARIDAIAAAETGLSARYYAQLKQVTGAGKVGYFQVLEAKDTAPLRGKTVRFQFKYKTGVWAGASALRAGIVQNNSSATADTVASSFVTAFGGTSVDFTFGTNLALVAPLTTGLDGCTLAGAAGTSAVQIANPGASSAWARASFLVTVPTSCVNLIVGIWTDGQMSVNDVLNLAEAGLYYGQEINDWNPLSYSDEYIRAARFYQKTFAIDTAPVQNVAIGTGEWSFVETIAGANANVSGRFLFGVRMRTTPTVTFFNPANADAFVRDVTHSANATVTTAVNTSDTGVSLTCTPTVAGTVGGDLRVHLTAEAAI